MAYTAKIWKTGEVITATDLNNLETGAQTNAGDIAAIQDALPTYVGDSVTKKAAATYTPGTANQTIAANQYLTGVQTIKGDANLVAGNIKNGTAIFGVTGTYAGTTASADPVLQAKSVTPSETAQTVTPDAGYDGLSSVAVGAVSSTYVGSGVPQKAAATYTPTTTDQSIASGQYLSGAQTIQGDANLLPGNIKSGVSIFGVAGSYEGTGSGSIDTSDATATAENIESGCTAYVNDELITGTLPYAQVSLLISAAPSTTDVSDGSKNLYITYASSLTKRIIGGGKSFSLGTAMSNFGDATAEDVVAGKTFTSAAGLKVTGTHECASSDPNLQSKTVTPSESQQIVSPDDGYDGLSSVTVGAVSSTYIGSGITQKSAATYTPGTSDQTIASGQYLSGAQTIKGDSNLVAGNIKSGVSIFGVSGTYAGSSGAAESPNNCEAYHITDASAALSFQSTTGDVKVWGYGAAKGSYTTTVYAFVGDGYYSGSYGTPTKTAVAFGLNADGTLSGLPSGLTALDVLVTKGV